MEEIRSILRTYLKQADGGAEETSLENLVERIKGQYATPQGKRLTNDTFAPYAIGSLQLGFTYKRDDLRILNPALVNSFLGTPPAGEEAMVPILTNSGQAAITVLLTLLSRELGIEEIAIATRAYVGTEDMAKRLRLKLTPWRQTPSRALWICSTNLLPEDLSDLLSQETSPYSHVVIDTTCWSLGSTLTQRLLEKFSRAEVFTLRSLTKLDMAGIEYGSLGVLQVGTESEELIESVFALVRLTGAAPSLDDIPPYLFDPRFRTCLEERTRRMIAVTAHIEAELARLPLPAGARCYFPPHQLYFFIYLDRSIYPEEVALQSILTKLMILEAIPAKVMASFGFDHCVISPIKNDESNRYAILRISPGEGHERSDRIVRALGHFFRRLMKPG